MNNINELKTAFINHIAEMMNDLQPSDRLLKRNEAVCAEISKYYNEEFVEAEYITHFMENISREQILDGANIVDGVIHPADEATEMVDQENLSSFVAEMKRMPSDQVASVVAVMLWNAEAMRSLKVA